MAKIETAAQLAAMCKDIAQNYKTLYVLGAFGWPMTEEKKTRAMKEQAFNSKTERKAKLNAATSDTFGFDCVGLIKALLWDWTGDTTKTYGGASYGSNSVPDIDADQMIKVCSGVSTDFSAIEVGEVVWLQGHIGVYIGDGLAVECTYRWADGVQITAVHNIGKKTGYNGRTWTKHGKLPYVTYSAPAANDNKEVLTVEMRTLKKGDKGEDVRALQILLTGNGCKGNMYEAGYGSFGANTEGAVKLYQKKVGLPQTGVADAQLWRSLLGV